MKEQDIFLELCKKEIALQEEINVSDYYYVMYCSKVKQLENLINSIDINNRTN